MAETKETCVNMTNESQRATFCSAETKWINKILKLSGQHPDEVKILYYPEDNHGVLLAEIPKNYMKISPPRQVNYTDEQKAEIAKRFAEARNR